MVNNAPYDFPYNGFSYYSGSQVTMWLNGVYVDDVYSLQFSRVQNKRPIYGYASKQFDAVCNGVIYIQGSFVINFKQSNYLYNILNNIAIKAGTEYSAATIAATQTMVNNYLNTGDSATSSIDVLNASIDAGNLPAQADANESVFWPGSNSTGDQLQTAYANVNPTQPTPTPPSQKAPDTYQASKINKGLTIQINYGSSPGISPVSLNDYMTSATKSITGVHLIGTSQVIQVGGQPVLEQYDFLAQGTDEAAGTQY